MLPFQSKVVALSRLGKPVVSNESKISSISYFHSFDMVFTLSAISKISYERYFNILFEILKVKLLGMQMQTLKTEINCNFIMCIMKNGFIWDF